MMIIGFTGRRGCGKDTAAHYLESRHGFRMLDFTRDILAPILEKEGRPVTRDNLIGLAMAGRRKSHNGIWAERLSEKIEGAQARDYVISGIRFAEEAEVFRRRFGKGFVLVLLACNDRLRFERVSRRATKGEAGISFEQFLETEKKPTESAIHATMEHADFVMDNSGDIEELYRKLDSLLKVLKTSHLK